MCNWRKSLKLFGQTNKIANIILEQLPTTRFIFVTFTVKIVMPINLVRQSTWWIWVLKSLTNKSKGVKITEKFKIIWLAIFEPWKLHTIRKKIHTTHISIAYLPLKLNILRMDILKNLSGNIFGASVARPNMSRL